MVNSPIRQYILGACSKDVLSYGAVVDFCAFAATLAILASFFESLGVFLSPLPLSPILTPPFPTKYE